jgi:ribosomal protein L37E
MDGWVEQWVSGTERMRQFMCRRRGKESYEKIKKKKAIAGRVIP